MPQRADRRGALRVGPESAGADPGPICYGKADRLTVTDANLFLGRLDPSRFLGGNMVLDTEKVQDAMMAFAAQCNNECTRRLHHDVVKKAG